MSQQSAFADLVWAHWYLMLQTANAAWWLSELWIFGRDWRRAKGVNADRSSRLIIILALALSIGTAIWCQRRFPFAKLPDGDLGAVRFASGIMLMWIGIVFRQWAVATLGSLFRTTVVIQDDHRLVTDGVYSHIRNPSYAGALMTMTGQGLIMGNWVSLLVCVGGILTALAWRIHVEEQALRSRFGDAYDNYAKQSWAIVPFVW